MLEPVVVNAPSVFPNMCVQCHGQTGPLVDTHVENRFGDRVYLCASCVRLDAIKLGLIKGGKHTELLNAAKLQAESERHLEAARETNRELHAQLDTNERAREALADELANARQRIEQLETALKAEAEASLAVVAAGAA